MMIGLLDERLSRSQLALEIATQRAFLLQESRSLSSWTSTSGDMTPRSMTNPAPATRTIDNQSNGTGGSALACVMFHRRRRVHPLVLGAAGQSLLSSVV